MFEASPLTERNLRREKQVRSLFLFATVLLVAPVAAVLGILLWRGAPALSIDFLLTEPRDGMTAGGIFPALVGTIWLVVVALIASIPVGVSLRVNALKRRLFSLAMSASVKTSVLWSSSAGAAAPSATNAE